MQIIGYREWSGGCELEDGGARISVKVQKEGREDPAKAVELGRALCAAGKMADLLQDIRGKIGDWAMMADEEDAAEMMDIKQKIEKLTEET